MSENKPQERPSEKAQKILDEINLNKLLSKDREIVARMCIDYDTQLREADKVISKLEKDIERMERVIESLKNAQNSDFKYAGFDKSKTLIEKIRFVLERNKTNMTYQEIKDTLLSLNPELNERWGNANKAVTHLLSKACRYGAIVKSKIYGNHGYYCYRVPSETDTM